MENEIIIEVGEKRTLTLGFLQFTKLLYCGMPNENTFSMAYMETMGYQGYGLNIFYPKNKHEITIGKHKFRVNNVREDRINLTHLK